LHGWRGKKMGQGLKKDRQWMPAWSATSRRSDKSAAERIGGCASTKKPLT
jgi:hypothetical protein